MPPQLSACLVHDAYRRLTYEQLVVFCFVRSLSTAGSMAELAARLAHYDLHHYAFPSPPSATSFKHDDFAWQKPRSAVHDDRPPSPDPEPSPAITTTACPTPEPSLEPTALSIPPPQTPTPAPVEPPASNDTASSTEPEPSTSAQSCRLSSRARSLQLPVEIMADILDNVGDWELSKALGIPTSLPLPLSWARANVTDHALLTGSLPSLRAVLSAGGPAPSAVGTALVIRFAYTHVLAHLFAHHRPLFRRAFRSELIPTLAMHHGRLGVLDWWLACHRESPSELPLPGPAAIADALDGASRTGAVVSLEWWLNAGLPLHYTEAALETASAKGRLAVLEWWRANRAALPAGLKVGRVMDAASGAGAVGALAWWAASGLDFTYDRHALYHASCQGHTEVLDWWLASGMQLFFGEEALVGATRHNRPEVLEWWDRSGLPIQYRMCDIEEALEDAIGGGENAREWWRRKGVDFNANDTEWMKLHVLNED